MREIQEATAEFLRSMRDRGGVVTGQDVHEFLAKRARPDQ
jgi:hypothetical protein